MITIPDKFKKVSPKQVTILLFFVPVIIAGLFIYAVYMPMSGSIEKREEEVRKKEAELSQSQVMQRKLKELKEANSKLQVDLRALTELLPTPEEGAKMPDMLTEMAQSSGLAVKLVKPGPKTPGPDGFYTEVPITVDVTGTYSDVGKFMEKIDRMTRLVAVTELDMSSAKMEGKKMNIPVRFTLLAFTAGGGK